MWVPEFRNNLMSVSSITENGYTVTSNRNTAFINRRYGTIVLTAKKENGLYVVRTKDEHQAMQTEKVDQLTRWHQRLGHLNFESIKRLHNEEMVIGMNLSQLDKQKTPRCETCDKTKIHQLPYKDSQTVEEDILGLVHTDICGPMSVPSLGGARYFATFINHKTRYMELALLKERF